jgi:hypothetical protein
MTFYLASRYSRRDELNLYRAELEKHENRVTSRWLDGTHSMQDDVKPGQYADAEQRRFAMEDYSDLQQAEVVISFTEEPRSPHGRGGRHVEFGIALAMRKLCVIIGPRENVFHYYPGVERFRSWEAFTRNWFPGWFS